MNCVKVLIQYGARIDVKNNKGHTAHEEASIGTGASMDLKNFFGSWIGWSMGCCAGVAVE